MSASRRPLGTLGHHDDDWRRIRIEEIDVLGTPVRVLICDEGGRGTPHLLVHGLGGTATNWAEVMLPLAANGPVVAVDLPGFGHTPVPDGGSARIRANVKFIPALIDALGWDRVVLHGNSMGGMIATMVAARWPDHVAALILADPALPPAPRHRFRVSGTALLVVGPLLLPGASRAFGIAMTNLAEVGGDPHTDRMLEIAVADPSRIRPAMLSLLAHDMDAADGAAFARGLVEAGRSLVDLYLDGRELGRAIDQIDAPTLLVWGDADRLVGRTSLDAVVARREDWTVHVLRGVGHVPMMEAPDDYVTAVLDHLGAQRRDETIDLTQPSPAPDHQHR